MRAMVIPEFGGPEVFEERDVPESEPGPNEVKVRVHATSVNPIDLRIRAGGGMETPAIIGWDVSGVVDAIGPGVERFEVGDEVFYTPALFEDGSYAEYHVEHESLVAHKPAGLSHVEAAALPVVACTAWEALVERGNVGPAETVLVHGAGGVGAHAVQLAAAAGARVLASCSPQTVAQTRRLGADRAIDYTEESVIDVVSDAVDGAGVDVMLDTVGNGVVEGSLDVMAKNGRMVDIVGDPGATGDAKFDSVTIYFMSLTRGHDKLDAVRRLVERNQLEPVIDSVLSLADVAEAHRRLEAGGLTGKLVLEPTGD